MSTSLRLPGNSYSENVPGHYLAQPKWMKAGPTGRTKPPSPTGPGRSLFELEKGGLIPSAPRGLLTTQELPPPPAQRGQKNQR